MVTIHKTVLHTTIVMVVRLCYRYNIHDMHQSLINKYTGRSLTNRKGGTEARFDVHEISCGSKVL